MSSKETARTPEASQALAEKILHYSRRYITQLVPMLLTPVYALCQEPVREAEIPMGTDGVYLFYNPERVIRDFQKDRTLPAKQLLHVISHCLLGHLPLRPGEKCEAFDCAADLKASQFAEALSPELAPEGSQEYWCIPDAFRLPIGRLMQKVEGDGTLRKNLVKYVGKRKLRLDDHSLWSLPPQSQDTGDGNGDQGSTKQKREGAGWSVSGLAQGEQSSGQAPDWQGMLQSLMESVEKTPGWGNVAGMLQEEYPPAEENGISYQDFLRRFAVPQERMLLDPDSFDPRWYWLGLEQYGDIPLLEPAEISEPPAPDDIVLALDTSGSCSGETCRRFLRETLNLLRDISAGASRFRILVLQCDTRIRGELFLEDAGQLESFLEDFTPSGFGGTDFEPVFRRVEALREAGTLPRVRGLLYLSDGFGGFPEEPPDYPVTFLLLEHDFHCGPPLPPWVGALVLNQDEFTLKEASR